MGVLDGKSAIVTGSARGIGRATAELLAAEGAQVLINDLDADLAKQAADEIKGETAVFAGDLTQGDAPERLVKAAVDAFGKIDIIVNNAGYTRDEVIHRMTDEQFQAMLDIHLIVPFKIIRAAAPYIREPAKKSGKKARRSTARSSTSPRPRAPSATPARPTTPRQRQASLASPRRLPRSGASSRSTSTPSPSASSKPA